MVSTHTPHISHTKSYALVNPTPLIEGVTAEELEKASSEAITPDIAPLAAPEHWALLGLQAVSEDLNLPAPIAPDGVLLPGPHMQNHIRNFLRRTTPQALATLLQELQTSGAFWHTHTDFFQLATERLLNAASLLKGLEQEMQEVTTKRLSRQEG